MKKRERNTKREIRLREREREREGGIESYRNGLLVTKNCQCL